MEQIKRLNPYLKERFGKKIYKISLNAGTTCPNRDGKIGTGGCIFCSRGGSGEFASEACMDIETQIEEGILKVSNKVRNDAGYIAYFQAFTGTYGEVSYLKDIFTRAASDERIVAISIATRPDCLEEGKLKMLEELNRIKPVMIELGFQTSSEKTADYIRRGYENIVFEEAVKSLRNIGIEVIVHIILGLPGETKEDMINTIEYLNKHDIQGVKLQLLHVLKDTDLADEYNNKKFEVLSLEAYGEILCTLIEYLRSDIIIHRLTGDGPKKILIAPLWSDDKKRVLNYINNLFVTKKVIQGRRCENNGNGFINII